MDQDQTNPPAVDDTAPATVTEDTGVVSETNDDELDEDGNPIPEEEEEIDLDDLKLKLPKSEAEKVKLAILRQADYTRKTQELAEARKAFDAERQSTAQADEGELNARANIALIDRQLAQYQQVNWAQFNDNDPFEAQKAFQNYQLLKDARTTGVTFLQTAQAERTGRQQQETATRLQDGSAELVRDIPGWSPELSAKLVDFGTRKFGLSKADFDGVDDPRAVKLLHAAYQWEQHQDKTKKAQSIQKQQEVTPAATVGRASAPLKGLDDRLSADEWMKRREAQLRKKG